ncbi:MAG TPA: hypothetical protein VM600_02470 [Actinomycetota bacterium]|nr:hypothetical protein [Actinomycetota bacterium]
MSTMTSLRVLAVIVVLCAGLVPAHASHDQGVIVQPVWFEWRTTNLDVIVVPPGHGQVFNQNGILNGNDLDELNPYATSYLKATENSIKDWDRAIAEYGSAQLQRVVTNVYVLGRDPIPLAVQHTPEIVIVSDENKGPILGFALNTRPCVVNNSKFFITSMTYEDMFNINSQEYGHCLGLNHVPGHVDGPEGDVHDPMNGAYPHNPGSAGTDLHCVSNVNVLGLEEVFAQALGRYYGAFSYVQMPYSEYRRPVAARGAQVCPGL